MKNKTKNRTGANRVKNRTGVNRKNKANGNGPGPGKTTPGNAGARGVATNMNRRIASGNPVSANQLRAINATPPKPNVPTQSQYEANINQQREAWYNNTSPTARRRGGSEVRAGNRTRLQPPQYPSYDQAYPQSTPLRGKKR